jgi:hypothetical protein
LSAEVIQMIQNPYDYIIIGSEDEEVKGGTIEGLVWCLVDHPHEKSRPWFTTCFLTTFLSFSNHFEVMDLIEMFYRNASQFSADIREVEVRRLRLLGFLRKWVTTGYHEFPEQFIIKLKNFVQMDIQQISGPIPAQTVTSAIEKMASQPPKSSESHKLIPELPPSQRAIFDLPLREVALQLTLNDFDKYSAIRPIELLNKNWISDDKSTNSPNVLAYIENFNLVGNLVASTVLKESDIRRRVRAMEAWISVGKHMRKLNNLHGVVAVISGLALASVHRLKHTRAKIQKKHQAILTQIQNDTSPLMNYANLRQTLNDSTPPCIPYLGLYFSDIVFLEDGNKSTLADRVINFSKAASLARVIQDILQYQQIPYTPSTDSALLQIIFHLVPIMNEDEQYERSLVIEPRGT